MSWKPVDFNSVLYSSIEGTHYFYDPGYPCTIQFLVSSKWEPYDVGFVKHNAQDEKIRRIAREAENRLVQDPTSGYVQKPCSSVSPDLHPTPVGVHPSSNPAHHVSPSAIIVSKITDPIVAKGVPLTSTIERVPDIPQLDPNLKPLREYSSIKEPATPYTSPYRTQLHSSLYPAQSPTVLPALAHVNHVNYASRDEVVLSNPLEILDYAQQGPHIQPAIIPKIGFSRTRETKILLSIDGDGIRGLSALLVIELLVNAICVKAGHRLDPHQIFDLTGGSSLGGVIAIMLCRLRMQPHRAREAYKEIARQVFYNKRAFFLASHSHITAPHIDVNALEEVIKLVVQRQLGNLEEELIDARIDAGRVFVVSTQVDASSNKAALMRSYQTRRITGPELDMSMPIWKAMKAATVAPRYISPSAGVTRCYIIGDGLVDHGTAKNNPVRDIVYEYRNLFRDTNDTMIVISVGTGIGLNRNNEIREMADSVESRQSEARTSGEKFEQEFSPLMERRWMKYFRFNVCGLDEVPLEEWACEDMIKEKTSAYLARPEIGPMFYACVDAITELLLGPLGR